MSLLRQGLVLVACLACCPFEAAPEEGAHAQARPAREIVAYCGRAFSVRARVAPELAEEKVTLALSGASWVQTRSRLAACLDAEWKQSTDGWVTLGPTATRSRALAWWREARRRRRDALARSLRESLARKLASDGGPRPPGGGFSTTFAPEIYPVVRALPPGMIDRALARPNPPFNGSEGAKVPGAGVGASQLSAAGRAAISRVYRVAADHAEARTPGSAGATRLRGFADDPSAVRLEVWVNEPAATSAHVALYLSLLTPNGGRGDYLLATGAAPMPSAASAEPKAEPLPASMTSGTVSIPPGRYRQDRFLIFLAEAAGTPLAADYYTKEGSVTVTPGKKRLGDALEAFSRAFGMVMSAEQGGLVLRSRDWVTRVDCEPRARVTDMVGGLDAKGPTLTQALEIAGESTDEQLATLEAHAGPAGEKLPLNLVPRLRLNAGWLRAAARLGPADRKAAAGPVGLFLDRLSLSVRETWAQALYLPALPPRCVLRTQKGPPEGLADWARMARVTVAGDPRATPLSLWRHARSY